MRFTSTTQNISWFRDRYCDGTLQINPPFQRKPVWTMRQKSYLIESILKDLPVPEVYIQHTIRDDGSSRYAVVDGQQRIRTVLQFIGVESDPQEEDFNQFSLESLEAGSEWSGIGFGDLEEVNRTDFYRYDFSVRLLKTPVDEEVKDLFRRLNKFLTPLNAQELRNATYAGPFARLANRLAEDDFWTEHRMFSPRFIRRMRDVEFVSDLLIGVIHGPQSGSAASIDRYYANYEDYEPEFPDQRSTTRIYYRTLRVIEDIFPDIHQNRWSNRSDFYSLFVAVGAFLKVPVQRVKCGIDVGALLLEFAKEVYARLANEEASVRKEVADYVRAIQRGANDKPRRADRHLALIEALRPYFSEGPITGAD